MTVWYISKYVTPPNYAAAGSRGFLLLREMVEIGDRCVLITSDSNHLSEVAPIALQYEDEKISGVLVRWVRTLKYSGARDWRRAISWLHFEWRVLRMPLDDLPPPDVVVASSLSIFSVISGFFLSRKYGAKFVFEVRDIWPLVLVEEGGFKRWNPFVWALGLVEKFGYANSDAVVGTMPNLAPHVERILGREKNVYCVPMGIDDAQLRDSQEIPPAYLQEYFPGEGKFIVCHAGSMGVTNALSTLIDCARLMRQDNRVHFLLVGDGYLKKRYQTECADLANITFAPRVPKQTVLSLLGHVDLVYFAVHPSRVLEFGQSLNKLIDYMLSGKPVLASYSGFPSMVDEAGCGTFVPADDATALAEEIRRYASLEPHERELIGGRGRDWILVHRRYKKLASQYRNILLSLLAR
jgi:glycosyltransferase involved in cell wall biosynthesis